jgi:hypothetical protein
MPRQTNITITGDAAFKRKLKALGPAALDAAKGSLYRSAEKIMTTSKESYVPVDTGNLRESGHVALPQVKKNEVIQVLGFGGPAGTGNYANQTNAKDVGYAIVVHEDPDAVHPVGQWKYLEEPARKAIPEIVKDLKDDFEEAFETIA